MHLIVNNGKPKLNQQEEMMDTISNGATGTKVRMLQAALKFLGYTIAVDGTFGNQTQAVVTQFQKDQKLTVNGTADAATWAILDHLAPQGIDTFHKDTIDFAHLSPHVQFAYCKASQGPAHKDEKFATSIAALKNAGTINGAYHFLTFQASAQSQLDNFMSTGYDFKAPDTLPPAVDIEWQVGANDAETQSLNQYIKDNQAICIKLATDFLTSLTNATRRIPVVYTAKGFLSYYLSNTQAFKNYSLWVPAYPPDPIEIPVGWKKYDIWQYYGEPDTPPPGICDLNIFNGNADDLQKFAST